MSLNFKTTHQFFLGEPCREFFTAATLLLAVSLNGCGSSDPPDNQRSSTLPAAADEASMPKTELASSVPVPADSMPRSGNVDAESTVLVETDPFVLTGVWYGESNLDVDAANQKLAGLPPEEARQLEEIINTFHTLVMAAEFRADAVLELDMMIMTPDGQQFRDRSIGTWNILETSSQHLKVRTSEYVANSQEPVEKTYLYKSIGKDRFEFVPENISPELLGFTPKVIFQRLEEELSDAEVAEQPVPSAVR